VSNTDKPHQTPSLQSQLNTNILQARHLLRRRKPRNVRPRRRPRIHPTLGSVTRHHRPRPTLGSPAQRQRLYLRLRHRPPPLINIHPRRTNRVVLFPGPLG
jgi:hypothetical protein